MTISEIQLYQLLKPKIGDREAEQLVTFVKNTVHSEFDNRSEILATKADIIQLKEEIFRNKAELLKSVYFVGLLQFLAIIGAVLAIVNFTLK